MRHVKRELTPGRTSRARKYRGELSAAESIAWKILRRKQIGFRFRRQHAIGPYILDFYCAEAMLALEFDGEQHDPANNAKRDAALAAKGIATLRIPNREFFLLDEPSSDWVTHIVEACEQRAGRRAWDGMLEP